MGLPDALSSQEGWRTISGEPLDLLSIQLLFLTKHTFNFQLFSSQGRLVLGRGWVGRWEEKGKMELRMNLILGRLS